MKKYIICLITGLLLLGTTGCNKEIGGSQSETPKTSSEFPEDMAEMVEPIDALVRCSLENNINYDPADAKFFWTALYYFLGEYGGENPLVTETEDLKLKVPKKVAQEYAIALFANYEDLLSLPESLSNYITYDEDLDAYLLVQGDRGLAETVLSNYKETKNAFTASAKLISTIGEKEVLGEWTVTMQKNVFSDSIEEPKYLYSVADIVPVNGLILSPQKASAIYNGLSDSHTVEVTLEDGTIQALQFYDSSVSEKLHALKEGDSFSFTYSKEDKTNTLTILEVE